MSSPQVLRAAICLIPYAASLDFIGTMDVLGLLVKQNIDGLNQSGMFPNKFDPAVRIEPTYFSPSKDPVIVSAGPPVHADKTYDEEGLGQYDILLVPGGECRLLSGSGFRDLRFWCLGSGPLFPLAPSMAKFLKDQAPGAKYIMSVCTGAFSLAQAGLLDGKKATTNKSSYKYCVVRRCISRPGSRLLIIRPFG